MAGDLVAIYLFKQIIIKMIFHVFGPSVIPGMVHIYATYSDKNIIYFIVSIFRLISYILKGMLQFLTFFSFWKKRMSVYKVIWSNILPHLIYKLYDILFFF